MASQPIYRFHAELADYQPRMWRRFEVPRNITLARLGYILMTLFEMQASHLFHFLVPLKDNALRRHRARFSHLAPAELAKEWRILSQALPEDKMVVELPWAEDKDSLGEQALDAALLRMHHAINTPADQLIFEYDLGDGWEIRLTLEDIRRDPQLPGKELPRVLEGEGYGIIEDCGGPGGLMDLAEAFQKKRGQHYRDMREWLGVDRLDLTGFDLEDMNFRLKKVPRIYRDIYEYQLEPTQQSLRILTREYLEREK